MRVEFLLYKKEKSVKTVYKILSAIIATCLFTFAVLVGVNYVERKFVYPIKFSEQVNFYANQYDLNPLFVYSVIKIESSFDKRAKSNKNAKGLMQLTDKTAGYIAKLKGVEYYDIYDVNTNVSFGCFYLRYLINRFDDEQTALVAYNAGEGNVREWLLNKEYSEDGVTLKIIPYKETREYIKKFQKTFSKYNKLYGNILDKSKNFE